MSQPGRIRMRRKYRVLHLITKLELGGAQQNTLYCTRHHDRDAFEVHLLAGAGGRLDAEALAIPDAQVSLMPELRHEISPWWDMLSLIRLRNYIVEHRIDLIHTHSSKAGILGRLAGALAGVPVTVHTVHGWSFNASQPRWQQRMYVALERMAAGLTRRMIVVATGNRDEGLRKGIGHDSQYQVIRSGIDIAEFATARCDADELRRELGFSSDDFVVGTVACLKPQKAPLDFVRAAVISAKENPRLRFFIAGDGELRADVLAAVKAAGLEDRFRLLGWREDVVDLLHAADLFLLTSLYEGLPRAVLQAMAAGCPVVATATDGTPEVIESRETGLLVQAGRPADAARAVLEIAADPDQGLAYAEAARKRLTASFDIRQMVLDLDRTYLSLLRGEHGG